MNALWSVGLAEMLVKSISVEEVMYIALYLVAALVVGFCSVRFNRSGFLWVAISIVVTPLIGFIALVCLGVREDEEGALLTVGYTEVFLKRYRPPEHDSIFLANVYRLIQEDRDVDISMLKRALDSIDTIDANKIAQKSANF
ncbi:hypothetical protein [Vibrio breoganii]|uniref:hypothetical protein n=1 Tax=Vibrio breoganii TaxID=553239 RepID=UPI0013001606|nr:hypothetical protein [Vibrio breoganii]